MKCESRPCTAQLLHNHWFPEIYRLLFLQNTNSFHGFRWHKVIKGSLFRGLSEIIDINRWFGISYRVGGEGLSNRSICSYSHDRLVHTCRVERPEHTSSRTPVSADWLIENLSTRSVWNLKFSICHLRTLRSGDADLSCGNEHEFSFSSAYECVHTRQFVIEMRMLTVDQNDFWRGGSLLERWYNTHVLNTFVKYSSLKYMFECRVIIDRCPIEKKKSFTNEKLYYTRVS